MTRHDNVDSLRDDIKQLLWVGFEAQDAPDPAYGAVVLFKRNLVMHGDVCDLDALVELCERLHRGGALIAIDQEGGRVQRIKQPATVWPPMLNVGDDAEQVGKAMGDELAALGIDIDFAPVLDVHTNPQNPIIGDRAFGRDAATVTERALAFARGLASAGVLACGKHFPGHGDTDTDSHLALPRIDHAWPRLDSVELPPFAAAARAELPMIMTAHVVFAAIDNAVPATLSKPVVTGLLRERLGYRGVIVSDDLDMKAIAAGMGADTAAVAAIRAGCDALLLCRDRDNQLLAEHALIEATEGDAELRARIGESAARVRALKAKRIVTRPNRDVVGSAAHRALAARLT